MKGINIFYCFLFIILSRELIKCGPVVGFAGCSTCCAAIHAPELAIPPIYGAKFAACMIGCIPLEMKAIASLGDPLLLQNMLMFKKLAGGFDIRDWACKGVGFGLKFTPTP